MFPVIFAVGPFELRTMSVFILLSFFLASFIFWRKCREEHYSLGNIFDSFLISTLIGAIVARTVFIIFNFQTFRFHVLNWLDLQKFSGVNLIAGLMAAAFYMYKKSVKNKWDEFEVLDFWVTGSSLGLFVYHIGSFLNGTGFGYATSLPWGVVFPQLIEPHHPVQMYYAIFYLGLYIYLSKVEYSYRTFTWYRHGKKTAQTGFLTSVFLIAVAIFSLLMSFLKPATIEFLSINFDIVIGILLAFLGIGLLFSRSGRSIPIISSKKPKPIRTKLEQLNE